MRQSDRPPAVVLARSQRQLLAQRLAADHERTGTDDPRRVTQLLERPRQCRRRYQTGADDRCRLQESRRRLAEVEPDRQRVEHLAALVVVDRLGYRLLQRLVAEPVGIEVLRHRGRIQRRTVGEGHARAQLERVLGHLVVDRPRLGNPRLDLQRGRILPGQLVGDLVQDAAVRVEAPRWRIQTGMRLLLQIDQRATTGRRRPLGSWRLHRLRARPHQTGHGHGGNGAHDPGTLAEKHVHFFP